MENQIINKKNWIIKEIKVKFKINKRSRLTRCKPYFQWFEKLIEKL